METSRMTTSWRAIVALRLHFRDVVVALAERRAVLVGFIARESAIGKAHELLPEGDVDRAGRAVALLANDDFRVVLFGRAELFVVGGLALDEENAVGCLLDASRLAQMRHHRPPPGPTLPLYATLQPLHHHS